MEPPRDDQLISDLRALRPTPRPQFAAELDQHAAAGFPRRRRLPLKSPPDLFTAMRNKGPAHPRRLLLGAGGAAILAITAVAAVIATGGSDEADNGSRLSLVNPAAEAPGSAGRLNQFSREEAAAAEEIAPLSRAADSAAGTAAAEAPAPADFNSSLRLRRRAVERSAAIVLGADPADVAEDSAKVFEAVHAHDGIVIRSSTREGPAGEAGASFELLIPSGRLGDALAAFSAIDEVRSRREATADITAPTVATGELLRESKARIDSLLAQLQEAETEAEREAVEAELRQERRHRSALRSQLRHLERRADLSRVSLRIETGASEDSSGAGTWGVDDALGDAGRILAAAAAVTVIVLAILGPIVPIAFLAWLTHRAWVRRQRRRVLS
jgi:Domain of unknown function (DUF4349)